MSLPWRLFVAEKAMEMDRGHLFAVCHVPLGKGSEQKQAVFEYGAIPTE